MVASLPVTPAPAVAGPFTGGQNVAHEPLHFDVVAVSGTNQYKVKPLALVTTVAPPILAVFRELLASGAAGGWRRPRRGRPPERGAASRRGRPRRRPHPPVPAIPYSSHIPPSPR